MGLNILFLEFPESTAHASESLEKICCCLWEAERCLRCLRIQWFELVDGGWFVSQGLTMGVGCCAAEAGTHMKAWQCDASMDMLKLDLQS